MCLTRAPHTQPPTFRPISLHALTHFSRAAISRFSHTPQDRVRLLCAKSSSSAIGKYINFVSSGTHNLGSRARESNIAPDRASVSRSQSNKPKRPWDAGAAMYMYIQIRSNTYLSRNMALFLDLKYIIYIVQTRVTLAWSSNAIKSTRSSIRKINSFGAAVFVIK